MKLFTGRQFTIHRENGVLLTKDTDGTTVCINTDTPSGFQVAVNNVNYNECKFDDLKSKVYKEDESPVC